MGKGDGLLSTDKWPRSYGTVGERQSIMLTSIDTKSIKHKLEPTDSLQILSVKYGVSVERLKRVNKLWSNDSIHIKEAIIIPCSEEDPEMSLEPTASLDSFT